jgi:hypothetical protein
VAFDGEPIVERRDRLQALLTGPTATQADFGQIVTESARFNIGPVARNFNVPTTVLFFFHPSVIWRFEFKDRGTRKIDGLETLELEFREVARPTLVMTRDGTDVPVGGRVWFVPTSGTVVRTRVRMRKFADAVYMSSGEDSPRGARPGQTDPLVGSAPPQPPPPAQQPPTSPAPSPGSSSPGAPAPGTSAPPAAAGGGSPGGSAPTPAASAPAPGPPDAPRRRLDLEDSGAGVQTLETYAEVEVTYRREDRFDLWLPWKMVESYQGPIPRPSGAPLVGRADCRAEYSNYRRFETSARVIPPK